MGALRKYQPSPKDKEVLAMFLKHRKEMSKELADLLVSVAKTEEPFFFFLGAREFSTQEAADILNVSRPFMIMLLKEGKIEFRKVGKHRRVNAASLMSYKRKLEEDNAKILDELTSIAQQHNLGY